MDVNYRNVHGEDADPCKVGQELFTDIDSVGAISFTLGGGHLDNVLGAGSNYAVRTD